MEEKGEKQNLKRLHKKGSVQSLVLMLNNKVRLCFFFQGFNGDLLQARK